MVSLTSCSELMSTSGSCPISVFQPYHYLVDRDGVRACDLHNITLTLKERERNICKYLFPQLTLFELCNCSKLAANFHCSYESMISSMVGSSSVVC